MPTDAPAAPLYYNEDSTDFFYNEDCTDFFGHGRDHTGGRGGAALDAYVDRIADAGVTTVLCNTNAQRTNYASDVWTPTWEGFDPRGPDDQPYLAGIPDESRANWRRLATNMLALHEQGVDYPARFLARSRERGMSPWISLRMNDVHDMANLDHPIHGRFWRERDDLWRRNCEGYYARAFDWGQREVRAYYMALIDETLERYDADGLELDFLREPYLFSVGEEDRGRELLTEWVGMVHERVDAAGRRRGRPIRLGVRSPSRPAVAHAFGMDPVAWARAGWVDLLVVSPRWSTIEFDMPLPEWRHLLKGCDTILAGGLEILLGRHWTAPKRPVTAAEARGAAAQVLAGGADAVYLFNYFPSIDPDSVPDAWPRHAYTETLRSLASLERIAPLSRSHAITFTDMVGPEGSPAAAPLPASDTDLTLHLPTGPRPDTGATVTLEIELAETAGTAPAPRVRVNGAAPLPPGTPVRDGAAEAASPRRLGFRFAPEVLADGEANRIELQRDPAMQVEGLEIAIVPAGSP